MIVSLLLGILDPFLLYVVYINKAVHYGING